MQRGQNSAVETPQLSKNAGFTGLRLGFTVIPRDLVCGGASLHDMWARRHGTKYNGAPYIVQRVCEACYSREGKAAIKQQVAYYMEKRKVYYRRPGSRWATVFREVSMHRISGWKHRSI